METGEIKDCEILIEYGRLFNVTVSDVFPIIIFSYPPKKNSEFELEKLPSQKSINPYYSNYQLTYLGQMNTQQNVYLNLNVLQRTRLKFHLYYHSDKGKSLIIDLLKMIFGTLLGVIGTLFIQNMNFSNEKNAKPEILKEEKIDSSLRKNETEIKKDSGSVKKLNRIQ